MKKKQVDELFIDDANRRKKISLFIVSITLISIVFVLFIYLLINSKVDYVEYNEKSDLKYKVNLNNNEFFDNENKVDDSKNRYIASLIKDIEAKFNYNFSIKEDVSYTYSYKIEADVTVKEKGMNDNIYHYREDLVYNRVVNSNETSVNISEDVVIDYNKYNNLIKRFIHLFSVDDVESVLDINMFVNVSGNCDKLDDGNSSSVISLSVPLTTKTVGVDLIYDLVDETKLMVCNDNNGLFSIYLAVSIILLLGDLLIVYFMIKYINNTRSALNIYQKELKKILNNYKCYIQKINNNLDLNKYDVVKVDTFTDMLEISDKVCQPILMSESNKETGVYFIIPSSTKLLYIFRLRVCDIEKDMVKDEEI